MEICTQCGREAINKLEACPSCGGSTYGIYNYTESFKSLKDAKTHSSSKWLDFKGRSRRNEFWRTSIINVFLIVALLALSVIFTWVMVDPTMDGIKSREGAMIETDLFAFIILGIYILGVGFFLIKSIIVQASVTVRRFHDIGLRGFWALIPVVPSVVYIALASCKLMGCEFADSSAFGTACDVFMVVSVVAGVLAIVALLMGSRPETNEYGTNPKELIRVIDSKRAKKSWMREEI